MQTLRDVMTRDVQVIPPTCTVQEAAEQMRKLDVGSLPICDGQKLIGIITDRDIAIRSTARGQDPKSAMVNDLMSGEPAWCFEDADVDDAIELMRTRELRRLPIVNKDKQLVGMVALSDIAHGSDSTDTAHLVRGVAEPRS